MLFWWNADWASDRANRRVARRAELPLWVIRFVMVVGQPRPVYRDDQTISETAWTSHLGQQVTFKMKETTAS
ncbi:hypothetical protein [Bradyrhizobium iriomotense]|uniref:Uncharacterized protein n=1 Tax=Bradyrhizobium iriomotense TaxID=441950 RepID=A0ABQ6AML1_9BRAD|nr:hypothetical protein [Bradyrhizobium iriomotense]GLR83473.1 hypothetical protein GCM10007857_01830 [Bradyrhizobium iriomotense]